MDYMLLSALLSAILTLSGCSNENGQLQKTVGTDGITNVQISGDASLIRLTTKDDQAQQATMNARPSGWLSGWFYNECKTKGDLVVSGRTLLIKAKNSGWGDLAECSTYLQINLPRNAGITIDQPAFKAYLQGQFADLSIATRAADISLQGAATAVKIRGDAFRTRLQFEDAAKPAQIDIAGRALDTSLIFAKGTSVSYRINSKASLLDAKLPNTPDAKPEILISGDYTRTEIR